MYSANERTWLFQRFSEFLQENAEFEGLLQIGSGTQGYTDIYSDIDLMAGCFDVKCVHVANGKLQTFLSQTGAIYVDGRSWSDTVLGFSAYFENGLSVDISFMPTEELRIRGSQWEIVFSKTAKFENTVTASAKKFAENEGRYGLNDSIHHKFIYALRKARIGMLRGDWVCADAMLHEARQILLSVEIVLEGKKLHQFKAYNTLDPEFLKVLAGTYPKIQDEIDLYFASENLLNLYLNTVKKCDFLSFDKTQLKLIDCFGEI